MGMTLKRRDFLRFAGLGMAGAALSGFTGGTASASEKCEGPAKRPNILFITADDMSYDSLGCTGCSIPDISPNLDRLASQGLLLDHCHIITPVCGPSRRAWITGALPQQTGYMGHYTMPPQWFGESSIKTNVAELLRTEGDYLTGVICKHPDGIGWDWKRASRETGMGRDASKFYDLTKEFIAKAEDQDKPFFLHANSMDPHDYWARHRNERKAWFDGYMGKDKPYDLYPNGKPYPDPDVDYQPCEIPVPPCWPDNADIREEIHTYYNSVKRLDDTMGAILKALRDSGQEDNTMVIFVSDHGLGKAFAKWSLYPLGTRTPLIVRWPGVTKPGTRDHHNVVSAIDFAPTFLEVAGLRPQAYMHGVSLVPIFTHDKTARPRKTVVTYWNYMNNTPERDATVTEFSAHMADLNNNYRPMRAVNSRRYTYIWNGWSDGKREIPMEMSAGQAIRKILMKTGHAVRADFEKFRTPEEFYDTVADPGCLHNLIAASDQQERVSRFREDMLNVMVETEDYEAGNFKRQVFSAHGG